MGILLRKSQQESVVDELTESVCRPPILYRIIASINSTHGVTLGDDVATAARA